jgi:hypothetical protein
VQIRDGGCARGSGRGSMMSREDLLLLVVVVAGVCLGYGNVEALGVVSQNLATNFTL